MAIGPARYALGEVVLALLSPDADRFRCVGVWDIRMPVALMAVVVGAALSVAGAQMQTILNNPLASPFTLGISAAASFGAALALVLGVALSRRCRLHRAGQRLRHGDAGGTAHPHASATSAASQWRRSCCSASRWSSPSTLCWHSSSTSPPNRRWRRSSSGPWAASARRPGEACGHHHVLAVAAPLRAARLAADGAAAGRRQGGELRRQGRPPAAGDADSVSLLAAVPVAFVGTIGFIGLVGPHIARMLIGEDQRFFLRPRPSPAR